MGPYWWAYAAMMTCNVVTPQFFWFRNIRRSIKWTFGLSIVVNIGMWFERFVIIATTLARDFIPSNWTYYSPSWVEVGLYLCTFGFFGVAYLLFIRVAPVVAIAEVKSILKSSGNQYVGPAVAEVTGEINAGLHHDDDHSHESHSDVATLEDDDVNVDDNTSDDSDNKE